MSAGAVWLKLSASLVGCVGLGYVTMKIVTPTPEQLYAKMSPEVRRKVDASRAQRLAAEKAAIHQGDVQTRDPDNEKPVWADPPSTSRTS